MVLSEKVRNRKLKILTIEARLGGDLILRQGHRSSLTAARNTSGWDVGRCDLCMIVAMMAKADRQTKTDKISSSFWWPKNQMNWKKSSVGDKMRQ